MAAVSEELHVTVNLFFPTSASGTSTGFQEGNMISDISLPDRGIHVVK